IDGGGANNALVVTGAHGVTLQNLTVRNGVSGIVIQTTASAALTNLTVSAAAFDSVMITGTSTATISNSVLTGTPINGVDVESTSSVIFTGTTSSSGAIAFGINIGTGSSMTLTGASVTVSNNGLGVQVGIGASAFIDPTSSLTALNNTTTGVTAVSGSHIVVFGGKLESDNNLINGFSADSRSGIDLDAASTLTTHGNRQDGVHLEETSLLNMFNTTNFSGVPGPTKLITHNNGMAGIRVLGNSEFHMHNQVAMVCQNNGLDGISLDNGSAATVIRSQITGNIGNDVALSFGSRGDLTLSTIGKINCDATSLIRGDTGITCPFSPPSTHQ
ncbi:MAG: right-handed parallel beta-helix repeat-containing protein, partial [Candidatus Binataceae bacterium]